MQVMKRIMSIVIVTLGASGALGCNAREFDNTPVAGLDLGRYLGRWYEIARYDHRFERGLQYTTADYSMTKGGKVKVVNSGVRDGKAKVSTGVARVTGQQGLLRVSFFRPFWSDYRVLMLGPDYEYALVGSRSQDYLWILSRSPEIPDTAIDEILSEMWVRGYSSSKLIWVRH